MADWKSEAERLYKIYGREWSKIATEMSDYFPELSFIQAKERVRGHFKRRLANEPIEPKEQETADDLVKRQKAALIDQNQKRIIAELSKKAAITEIVVEKTCSAIAALPKFEFKPVRIKLKEKDNRSEEEVILDISDIQAGTKIDGEGTGGLNEFNWDIMENEFDTLLRGVVSIMTRQMELAPIKKLHIFMLGDMVEGWDIFSGQPQNIDQDILNQVYLLENTTMKFILQLMAAFPELTIEISCVVGNHGRVGKKGENPHWVNWDMVFYKNLEKSFLYYPNVIFNIPKAWYYIQEVNGWKFLLQHGDDVKGWGGIPFYGIDRSQKNDREMLETINEKFDYIEMGHLHTPAILPLMGGGFITMNGCWPGGSILSMKNMKKTGKPIQWIKGVHPERGMTWTYPIYLNGR